MSGRICNLVKNVYADSGLWSLHRLTLTVQPLTLLRSYYPKPTGSAKERSRFIPRTARSLSVRSGSRVGLVPGAVDFYCGIFWCGESRLFVSQSLVSGATESA